MSTNQTSSMSIVPDLASWAASNPVSVIAVLAGLITIGRPIRERIKMKISERRRRKAAKDWIEFLEENDDGIL